MQAFARATACFSLGFGRAETEVKTTEQTRRPAASCGGVASAQGRNPQGGTDGS